MDIPILPDLVSIFCLSIGVLLICHRIRIPPIVGFLLTGVLCGPTALGLVQDVHAVELL
ncbi:MAG: cation:proton antiporter, partial [Bilophila sp.]